MNLRRLVLSVFLIVMALTSSVLTSQAAIIYAASGGASSGLCDSWAAACELRYALANAVSGQEIWVKAGTYTPNDTGRSATFQLKSGVGIYGGFAGAETDLNQRNWTTNVTVLSGSATNSYHVVTGANNATLDGVTVTGGNADGTGFNNFGGGLYNEGSSPTLANCIFSGNRTTGAGAGMYNNSNSPTLTNCTFSNNQSTYHGGGMYNGYSSPTLTYCTFSGNLASFGGGVSNYRSNPALINCTFNGNPAGTGGGIYDDLSNTTLTNCTLSGNNAMSGGGMYLNATSPVLTNCTFSGNQAGSGGGIYDSGGGPTLINCTFSGNSASSGGGIYNYYGFPTIRNSILWGDSSAELFNDSPFPLTISDSLVQGGSGNDPLLATLGNYGGAMQTIPLLPGSSAIDAGNGAYCPATDQRGVARPQGSTCDMGAFESRGFTLTKSGGDNQSATINNSFTNPLALTVTARSADEPVNGGLVTFTAPASGASLNPVTSSAIIAAGAVSQSIAANATSGSYSVTASAAGADPVSFSLTNTIVKASQTLSFGPAPAITVGGVGTVSATASSGLTVTFSSDTSSVCTVSGTTVTGVSAGTCTITASQSGSANYTAALPSAQSFAIDASGAPLVTTLKATGVEMSEPYRAYSSGSALRYPSTVVLNGTVTAAVGDTCLVSFEYGATTAYGSVAPVGSVGGGSAIPVSATAAFSWAEGYPVEDPVRHYRVKAVCNNGGTRYGNDIAFVPFDRPPAANIEIIATCNDSATMANYYLKNYNNFDVSVDYTSGADYHGYVLLNWKQMEQIFVGKGSITSFSYNYTLFSQMITDDQLCSATPDPSNQIQIHALGTTAARAAIYTLSIKGNMAASLPVSIIAGSDQFDATAPVGSEFGGFTWGGSGTIQPQYIATEIAEAQVSYNGTAGAIASPTSFPWAPSYVVSAAPVSSTPTTALFLLQNNDDAAHTVVLRNGAGTEHRYTLPAYVAQQVTVPYDTWGLYLVIPGMVGPKMVGDHILVGTLYPALVDQMITFGTAPDVAIGAPATASATASSGLAVAFSSLTPTVCTVSGATVTGVMPGPCTIAANQAGNSMYAAAAGVTQDITVIKGSQTIAFGAAPAITAGSSATVSATASSGLAVSFSSQTGTICSVSGATVTGLAMGPCTIAADQPGDANYNAAPQVTQSFTIAGVGQTISFAAIPDMLMGSSATASATATSGLPVVFSSLTPLTCGVSGATVTGVAIGVCTIAADQPGNGMYTAAPRVTQSFTLGKGNHDLAFGPAPAIVVGGTGTVSAGDASGATVLFSSLTPAVCTVSGATVTGAAAGLCTIAANLPGDSNYYVAGQVTQSFAITPAGGPIIGTLKPSGLVANGEPVNVLYNSNTRQSFPTKGMLNGLVNPNNDTCTVSFEYGPTTAYGTSVGYGTVSGAALVPVSSQANFTWIHDYFYNPELHYRTKAVCATSGTWYGNDITFVPFTSTVRLHTDQGGAEPVNASFPTLNIHIATCSDSPTTALYDILSCAGYTVTVDYSAGGASLGSATIGDWQTQQFSVDKAVGIASFSYHGTLFNQTAINEQSCLETLSPPAKIRAYALGLADTKAASGSEIFAIYNDNPAPVTLEVTAFADVFNVTIPARSGQLIATGEAEAQLSYNAAPFQVISPLSIFWADRYLVTAAPVSSTVATSDFLLRNNDDAAHTVVLRNGAGTEHRYTLPAYGSQTVTVEYGNWDLYLVVPGMVGSAMVGDHVKVAALTPGPYQQGVSGLIVNPATPQQLVAGIFGAGIMRSSDNGATWTPAAVPPSNIWIKALASDPADPATIYAASSGSGVFRSSDNGNSWSNCDGQPANLNVVSLAIDATGRLYAGTEGGIFTSSDCTSWSGINTGLTVAAATPPVAIAIDPVTPATLYAGLDGAGIYKSDNGGSSWTAANITPATVRVKALVLKPGDCSTLYGATYGTGIYKSTNNGADWAVCTDGLTANSGLINLNVISLTSGANGTLYAGTEAGVFVSTDGCAIWTEMNSGLPN